MAILISCQTISKSFGLRQLFDGLSFSVADGEHIGLIGPNGAGKSTLMRILAGLESADDGIIAVKKGVRAGYVSQEPDFGGAATVRQVAEEALKDLPLEEAEREARINTVTGRAGFTDLDAQANLLSGGWRKRLALVRELLRQPDVLLLDEPTNHLDIEGIEWVENLITSEQFATVVVSHDRYFLENVATGMVEINRIYPDGMFRVRGNYSEFLVKREEYLEAQSKYQEALANRVNREVDWLRRGPKARTSKSKARIDDAHRMIGELKEVNARAATSQAQVDFTGSERKTKKLVHAQGITLERGGRTLVRDLSFTLTPGMRVGLVGPNGSGKTTLLRSITGELTPDKGVVERADALQVVYFDQNREQLELDLPLRKALCPNGDHVIYRDRAIHVVGWAKRFLFRADQLDLAVSRLSGGERARLLIARLMLRPADVLLLDEPTNDLDIPTLEVLDETLVEFPGALLLVTHDRYLLDSVCTSVLGLDGAGGATMFADYRQWQQWRSKSAAPRSTQGAPATKPQTSSARKKLSYLETREYEQIEAKIHEAESLLAARQADMQNPEFMRDAVRLAECYQALLAAQAEVDRLYMRWGELESKHQLLSS